MSSFAEANTPYLIPEYKHITIEDGLTHSTVYDVIEDKRGYVWLATQRGVDRYDGHNFVNFRRSENPASGLTADYVLDIELDQKSGDIWFATMNGLSVLRFDTQVFEHILLPESPNISEAFIRKVYIDNQDHVWVATDSNLYKKPAGQNSFQLVYSSIRQISLADIVADENGILYVSSGFGILRYDINASEMLAPVLQNVTGHALLIDSDKALWVGSYGQGLYKLQPDSNGTMIQTHHFGIKDGMSDGVVSDIIQLPDGSIWASTPNGISILPSANESEIIKYKALRDNATDTRIHDVRSLYANSDGKVFFGTLTMGLGIIDPSSVLFQRILIGQQETAYSLHFDSEENLWIAADSGVYVKTTDDVLEGPFPLDSVQNQQNAPATKNTAVHFSAKHGWVWLGTRLGLNKINKGSEVQEFVSFKDIFVYSLHEDKSGLLWVGTANRGLYLYDPIADQIIYHWNLSLVTGFAETEDFMMVGSANGLHIIRPNSKAIRSFKNDPTNGQSLVYDVVTWVSERSKGEYFVGTQSKGLVLLELDNFDSSPIFRRLFEDTQLETLSIGAVLKDDHEHYWISTTEGLARADSHLSSIIFFGKRDGADDAGYFVNAYAKNSKGEIFFAGVSGVTQFQPDDINLASKHPQLIFSSLRKLTKNGQKLEQLYAPSAVVDARKIVLQPDDLLLEIGFNAIEYSNPENIEYAYKLEGFHNAYQTADSNNRFVTFTNLAPGNYRFSVRSTNRYKVWNEQEVSIDIEVRPIWWQTNLARFSAVLLIFGLVYIIFKWRIYTLDMRSNILAETVKQQTSELKAANERLKQLSNMDPLTNLLNRRGFSVNANKVMSKYQRDKERFSIILFDVDEFKAINDEHGHDIGDQALINVADHLKSNLRAHDIAARWGGEEFIVLLPSTELDEAVVVANKLTRSLEAKVFSQKRVTLTVSAGVAEVEDGIDLTACIKHVDECLYRAKKSGKNRVCSAQDMA